MKIGNGAYFANALFKTNTGKTIEQAKVGLSKEQINQMEHALGLSRKKKPSRNYFYTDRKNPIWADLVEKGIAKTATGWEEGKAYFRLTFEGAKLIYAKPMSKKYFDDLP